MKQFITILLACFAFGAGTAMAQAELKFEKSTINLGTFPEEKQQVTTFVFTNTGDQPLVIHQAMSTCGCTVPSFTKTPIKPGEKGSIKVTYNGKGKPEGHFKKGITIRSNAKNSLARIYIEGVMEIKK